MKYFVFIVLGLVILGGIWVFGRPVESLPEADIQTGEERPSATINGHMLELEIMRTPGEQARGLSGRESREENAGMLFVYETLVTPGFWMKEMNFSIDIIWIDADKRVVDISENLAPETFPELFHPRSPVQYVLEVNAGWADAHNISIGDPVEFQLDL
ncbi:MAG TPA: DUF192 domain-containing protein [Candidatus Paceibacterota bacterium]